MLARVFASSRFPLKDQPKELEESAYRGLLILLPSVESTVKRVYRVARILIIHPGTGATGKLAGSLAREVLWFGERARRFESRIDRGEGDAPLSDLGFARFSASGWRIF